MHESNWSDGGWGTNLKKKRRDSSCKISNEVIGGIWDLINIINVD